MPLLIAVLLLAFAGWLVGVIAFFKCQSLEEKTRRLEDELGRLADLRERLARRAARRSAMASAQRVAAPVTAPLAAPLPPVIIEPVPPVVPASAPAGEPAPAVTEETGSVAGFVSQAEPPPLPSPRLPPVQPPPLSAARPEDDAEDKPGPTAPDESWVSRWALRAGAVLGVLAVLFLVYQLNLNSPPWLRWVGLMAFATGLAAFGRIGSARGWILAQPARPAGLALAHLGVFAGHAFPAVRVFETPLAGGIAMTVATVVLGAVCLWENRPKTCAMILAIGQICALFLQGDVGGIWLPAQGLGLLALAAWMRAGRGWEACFGLAYVGHVAQLVLLGFDGGTGPGVAVFTALAAGGWLIAAASELWEFRRNPGLALPTLRLSLPAALAAGASVLYANQFGNEPLWPLWLLWTGLFAGASALARAAAPGSPAGGVFELQAWSALAATLVARWAGDARWLALMIEAGLLLWRSARSENLWLRGLSWVLWLASLVVFADWRDGQRLWLAGWWNAPWLPSPAEVRPLLLHVLMLGLVSAWHGLVWRWTVPFPEARLWGRAISLFGVVATAALLVLGETLSPADVSLVLLAVSLLWLALARLLSAPWLGWTAFAGWLAAAGAALAGRFMEPVSGMVEFDPERADLTRLPSLASVLVVGLALLGRVPAGMARTVTGLVAGAVAATLLGSINCGVVPPLAVLAALLAGLPWVVRETPWAELRAGLAWGALWLLPAVFADFPPTANTWELTLSGLALLAVSSWHLHTENGRPLRQAGLAVAGLIGAVALQTGTLAEVGAPLSAGLALALAVMLRRTGRPGWVLMGALFALGAFRMLPLAASGGSPTHTEHLLTGLTLLLLLVALGFALVRRANLAPSLRRGLLLLGALLLPCVWQGTWQACDWPFGAAVSLGWTVVPLVLLSVGVWLRLRPLRIAGGLWLIPVFLRVLAVDLADTTQRVIAVGALSALLLLVGWGYKRAAAWLREDLT